MALSGSINFISQSAVGAYVDTGQVFFGKDEALLDADQQFVPLDFVGLNTVIHDPISASLNTLGFPSNSFDGMAPFSAPVSVRSTYAYKGGTNIFPKCP